MVRTIAVAKLILRRKIDGKYLILRSSKWEARPDRSRQPDLPGGAIENGESPQMGAVRELQEEAGIDADPSALTLVHAYTFQSIEDDASITRLIYFIEVDDDPAVTLSWEHESYEWMSAEQILAMDMRPPYPEMFQYLSRVGVLV